jgi:hypothetical protein
VHVGYLRCWHDSDFIKRGDLDHGLRLLRGRLDLSQVAEALAHAGRVDEGLALVEAGIEQSDSGWLTPELLRLKGEFLLLQGAPALPELAEALHPQVEETRGAIAM